jgi:hypothetical protein
MSTLKKSAAKASAQKTQADGKPSKSAPYQQVSDLIIEHLEKGVVPWRCPWNCETGRRLKLEVKRKKEEIRSPTSQAQRIEQAEAIVKAMPQCPVIHEGRGTRVGVKLELRRKKEEIRSPTSSFILFTSSFPRVYLGSWLSGLKSKDHRRWIVQAASQATHAADFTHGRKADDESPEDAEPWKVKRSSRRECFMAE